MGLNEVALVRSEGERMISKGTMVKANQAKRLGLIDDVVNGDSKQLIHSALRVASKFSDRREAPGRAATKLETRIQFANEWENYASEEAQKGWDRLCDADVVKSLSNVISRLSARKAKI
ncbi:ClpP/crotonase-like protein [Gracilaria domingensis]|nr:ClpP/crotonase-like protein [Gracilaria domingensis]